MRPCIPCKSTKSSPPVPDISSSLVVLTMDDGCMYIGSGATRGSMELVILHGRRATCRRARANAAGQAAPLRRPVGRVGLAKPRVATMHEAPKALAFFHVPVASPPPASVHPSHQVSGRGSPTPRPTVRAQPRRRRPSLSFVYSP